MIVTYRLLLCYIEIDDWWILECPKFILAFVFFVFFPVFIIGFPFLARRPQNLIFYTLIK